MMNVKYQIFVSSTYEDLKLERDHVMKAILEMGHIPVGMEMFSAADEDQWKTIQRQIDDCDYYVIIAAHKYGSMDGDISYTEKEYNYATLIGVPTLGFIIDESISWPVAYLENDSSKREKLDLFKNKIKRRLVKFWNSKEDLQSKVSIALMKQFSNTPRVGWIKAIEAASPDVLNEISRLSKENSELRSRLDNINIVDEKNKKIEYTLNRIKNTKILITFYYMYGTDWENQRDVSLLSLFETLAPVLMTEYSISQSSHYIGLHFNEYKSRELRNFMPVPENVIQAMYADFSIFDLVQPSQKKHPVKDTGEYWMLSKFGIEVFKKIRIDELDDEDKGSLQPDIDKDNLRLKIE